MDFGMDYHNEACQLISAFRHTGDIELLGEAISSSKRAVVYTGNENPLKVGRLNTLGIALKIRSEQTGSMEDLNSAVARLEEALNRALDSDEMLPMILFNLGNALQRVFERTNSSVALDRAVILTKRALDSRESKRLEKASYSNSYGAALQLRYERDGSLDDLNASISAKEVAVRLAKGKPIEKRSYMHNLAISLRFRFIKLGEMKDLDQAIDLLDRILPQARLPDLTEQRRILGEMLQTRYQHMKSLADLMRACVLFTKALGGLDHENSLYTEYTAILGIALTLLSVILKAGQNHSNRQSQTPSKNW